MSRTGLIMGFAVSASAVTAVMNGCSPAAETAVGGWKPAFVPADQMELLAEIAETILPKTATPGAKDVMVHQFIDAAFANFYQKDEREHIAAGMAAFDSNCETATGKSFMDLTAEERTSYLVKLEDASKIEMTSLRAKADAAKPAMPVRQGPLSPPPPIMKPFFTYIKELTLLGYFTSEEVGENVLSYVPIPGQYIDCMDLEEGQRIYSL